MMRYAVRIFANLYFTPIAFGLALAGYGLVVWRSFWRAPALILMITTLAVFLLLQDEDLARALLARAPVSHRDPAGALIFASAAMFAPVWLMKVHGLNSQQVVKGRIHSDRQSSPRVLLGYRYLSASLPIREHVEYADLIPRLERLASRFSDNDLVLVEARAASDLACARAAAVLYLRAQCARALRLAPRQARCSRVPRRGRTNVTRTCISWPEAVRICCRPASARSLLRPSDFRCQSTRRPLTTSTRAAPVMKPFDFTIYRLVQTGLTPPPQSLDIGGTDDLHLVDFHPKERLGGGDLTFRWTQDTSYLLMSVPPGSREVTLRLSGGRPRGVPLPRVTVYLEGQELGSAELTNDFRDYVFPIPAASGIEPGAQRRMASRYGFKARPGSRGTILGGSDTRALGVMIDEPRFGSVRTPSDSLSSGAMARRARRCRPQRREDLSDGRALHASASPMRIPTPNSSAAARARRRSGDGARRDCHGRAHCATGADRSRRRKLECRARRLIPWRGFHRNTRRAVDGTRRVAACPGAALIRTRKGLAQPTTTISRSTSSPTFAAISCWRCRRATAPRGFRVGRRRLPC